MTKPVRIAPDYAPAYERSLDFVENLEVPLSVKIEIIDALNRLWNSGTRVYTLDGTVNIYEITKLRIEQTHIEICLAGSKLNKWYSVPFDQTAQAMSLLEAFAAERRKLSTALRELV